MLDELRRGDLVHVLPQWRSPDVGVYVLMPSRKFLEAKTRAWIELLKAELPLALERDAISIKTLVKPDGKPNRRRSGAGVRR
ncbi:hypothetical protein P3T23_004441 [Paraburkholderia sp. GAS448]